MARQRPPKQTCRRCARPVYSWRDGPLCNPCTGLAMLEAGTPFRERQHPAGQLTIDHDLVLPEDVDGLAFGEWMLELAKCGTQASGS